MIKRHGVLKLSNRAAALAAVAAMSLAAVAPSGAVAAPANDSPATVSSHHGTSDATDISARRRHYRGGGGNAAGLAAFGAIVGTIGAIAASNSGPRYYDNGYYGGGPAYYSGPGYGGGGYYGGGYYGGPYRGYGGGHGYDNSRRMTW